MFLFLQIFRYRGNNNITTGKWLLWAQVNQQTVVYRTYHIYDITVPETPDEEPTPATDPEPTPKPTPNQNVNTGVSNIAFVVVPIILAVGVYITVRKNRYTED